MKEVIRQYSGTVIAVLVAVMMLAVIGHSLQSVRDSASAGRLGKYGKVLVVISSADAFDRYWSSR